MAVAVLTAPTILTAELAPNGKGAATNSCLQPSDPLYYLVYVITAHISVKFSGHWMSVDHTFAGLSTSMSCCLDSLRALNGICIPGQINAPIADHFYHHVQNILEHTPIKFLGYWCSDARVMAIEMLVAAAVQTAMLPWMRSSFSGDLSTQMPNHLTTGYHIHLHMTP